MKRLLAAAILGVAWSASRALADPPTTRPVTDAVDRSFAVVVSESTYADPDWKKVADKLIARHGGTVVQYKDDVSTGADSLRKSGARYAAFVAKPAEAGRRFVVAISRMTRTMNDDPYGDVLWGIVTGYSPADALRVASQDAPLTIKKAGAGTPIDLGKFESGTWFSEATAGAYTVKAAGQSPEKKTGPADSTAEIAEYLSTQNPDLFMTSGHASEHNWALGYKYKNGQFVSKAGKMYGLDLDKQKHPIESTNPKVFMAVGNCLMGHIDGDNCMALGWMGSGGVDQFVGYTVVTWFGAMGWGVQGYLFDQPGKFDVAESFYFSNQCVTHDLLTKYPKAAGYQFDWPEKDGNNPDKAIDDMGTGLEAVAGPIDPKKAQERLGLAWDRDVVVFYGDPLWDARLATRPGEYQTALSFDGSAYHFTVTADENVKTGKPVAMLLPRRLHGVKIVTGQEFDPVVTENFVMLFKAPTIEKGKTYEVTFTADTKTVLTRTDVR